MRTIEQCIYFLDYVFCCWEILVSVHERRLSLLMCLSCEHHNFFMQVIANYCRQERSSNNICNIRRYIGQQGHFVIASNLYGFQNTFWRELYELENRFLRVSHFSSTRGKVIRSNQPN